VPLDRQNQRRHLFALRHDILSSLSVEVTTRFVAVSFLSGCSWTSGLRAARRSKPDRAAYLISSCPCGRPLRDCSGSCNHIVGVLFEGNLKACICAAVMNNKRDQRQNAMKAGTILFGGSGIDCLVRNISDGGANLEVESQIGIPNSFDLVIDTEHSNHHCHVIWRKARRIGIAFD
jgi:hypothetical protein